jgi:hypothetical protein
VVVGEALRQRPLLVRHHGEGNLDLFVELYGPQRRRRDVEDTNAKPPGQRPAEIRWHRVVGPVQ